MLNVRCLREMDINAFGTEWQRALTIATKVEKSLIWMIITIFHVLIQIADYITSYEFPIL
jgi:hypothetical protein